MKKKWLEKISTYDKKILQLHIIDDKITMYILVTQNICTGIQGHHYG